MQIILSLLSTWFIDPDPNDKSGKKIVKIDQKYAKLSPKMSQIRYAWQSKFLRIQRTTQHGGHPYRY